MKYDRDEFAKHCGWGGKVLVWDDSKSRLIEKVLWVDDEANTYATITSPMRVEGGSIVKTVHRARKVVVYAPLGLVVVDPVTATDYDRAKSLAKLLRP